MITVFTEGSPPNKESAEPRLAQAIGDDYVNGRARSDITEVVYPTKQGYALRAFRLCVRNKATE